jgi:hypothetical protein
MHGSKSRPWVWEGSTDRVLVMEHMGGTSVGEDAINRLLGGPKRGAFPAAVTVPSSTSCAKLT